MRTGILIVIGLMFSGAILSFAAVPYGTDLANVYVRPLDGRDKIYEGIGIPPKQWTDIYGGLSERTLIMGNLSMLPKLINDVDSLKKKVNSLEKQVAELKKKTEPKDPNEAKK